MGMVKSRRERVKYRAFYPTDLQFPSKERYRLTDLQLNILNYIKENQGVTQREIAKILNKKRQTINYNIKMLQQSKLLMLKKKGRKTLCFTV